MDGALFGPTSTTIAPLRAPLAFDSAGLVGAPGRGPPLGEGTGAGAEAEAAGGLEGAAASGALAGSAARATGHAAAATTTKVRRAHAFTGPSCLAFAIRSTISTGAFGTNAAFFQDPCY